MVVPIIHGNVREGLKNTPNELIEMMRLYNVSPVKRLTKLYINSILPYFIAGFKTSLGLAWKAGVAAEVLCTPTSAIGTELYFSKTYLDTELLFAWTIVTIILSLVIEKCVILLLSKLPFKIFDNNTEVRA